MMPSTKPPPTIWTLFQVYGSEAGFSGLCAVAGTRNANATTTDAITTRNKRYADIKAPV
jgi:hypothetical protein